MKADHLLQDASMAEDEKTQDAIVALKEIAAEIKKVQKPTGERDAPGRTCREIAASATDTLRNGMYWIDPNGGGVADAIEVFCRFDQERLEKTQTCLVPDTETFEKKAWFASRPASGEVASFVENMNMKEFSYNTHKGQIKYLQMLTSTARQKITIKCKNVVAVFDSGNSTYEQAVRLDSFDEEQIEVHGKKAFRYRVVQDGCKERNGEWGETHIEVRGKQTKIKRIPIMDIGLKDVAGSGQEFGIEIGKACFTNV